MKWSHPEFVRAKAQKAKSRKKTTTQEKRNPLMKIRVVCNWEIREPTNTRWRRGGPAYAPGFPTATWSTSNQMESPAQDVDSLMLMPSFHGSMPPPSGPTATPLPITGRPVPCTGDLRPDGGLASAVSVSERCRNVLTWYAHRKCFACLWYTVFSETKGRGSKAL